MSDGGVAQRLVSLEDIMRPVNARALMDITRAFTQWNAWTAEQASLAIDDNAKATLLQQLQPWDQFFVDFGFTTCRASLLKIYHQAGQPGCTWGELRGYGNELMGA